MHKKHLRQAFCSGKCRSNYHRTVKRLTREDNALQNVLFNEVEGKANTDHVLAVHSAVLRMLDGFKARYDLAVAMPLKTHYEAFNA